jgi:hypothetical protein
MFHIKEQLQRAGFMIDACDVKKGPYKINNFLLDSQYYPKYAPMGRWRINIKCHHEHIGDIFFLQWYLELKPAKM